MAPVKFPLMLKATLGLPFCAIAPGSPKALAPGKRVLGLVTTEEGPSFRVPMHSLGLVPRALLTSLSSWPGGAAGAPSVVPTTAQEEECSLQVDTGNGGVVCPLGSTALSPRSGSLPSSHGTLLPGDEGSRVCGLWGPVLTSAQGSENPQVKRASDTLGAEDGLSRKRGLSKNMLSSSGPHSGDESGAPSLGHASFQFSPSGPLLSSPEAPCTSTGGLGWRPESRGPTGLEGKAGRSGDAVGRQHLSSALIPSVFSSSS